MIDEITIRGLGVIDEAVFSPGPGFTALTGETGAGKTMVVTALGLLLGQRADSSVVRSGYDAARVDGRWIVDAASEAVTIVDEVGGDVDTVGGRSELIVSRAISREGRGRAALGGCASPVGTLAQLAESLVVVHGQSDQMRLRSPAAQRQALDRFGGVPIRDLLTEYECVYKRWKANSAELAGLVRERDERERRLEDMRFAVSEIETIAPQPGEDRGLAERAERIRHSEDLRTAATTAREIMSADDGSGRDVLGLIDSARREMERAAVHDPALVATAETLASLGFQVADVAAGLSRYVAGFDSEGGHERDNVESRRSDLASLTRKYGDSIDDVLAFAEACREQLADLEQDSERREMLAASVADDAGHLDDCAARLSDARAAAGECLAAAVTRELAALAMPDAKLVVSVTRTDELSASGGDRVEILLQAHEGASPAPLSKGASGGELSRVMLAIEVVIAGNDPVDTFVFDEIDAGVGGAAAIEIGRRLRTLSESSQVIVVTHLAQVAAFASDHLVVVKGSDGVVTTSSVRRLEGEEREAEIARLLSGLSSSSSGIAHAKELLAL